ncbi:MAG: substrate-binding domain-containing protein, partial [Spirochaetota bacterium]
YTGPDVYSFEKFYAMLEGAIASKPNGLLCTMTNPEAMDDLLRKAIANGLPVMGIDTPDSRDPLKRIPYLSYLGDIPYAGGVLQGREALKRFRPKRVVYGNHHPGALNIQERGQGLLDVMKSANIPAEAIDITEDPVKGAEILLAYLKAHPDTDTISLANPLQTEALTVRLEESGLKPGKDIKIIMFDISEKTLEMMEQKKIVLSLDEQPYMQGVMGVAFMYLHIKYGFNPPPEIPTNGLYPENIKWLTEMVKQGYR